MTRFVVPRVMECVRRVRLSPWVYPIALLTISVILLLRHPIVFFDSDVWIHLSDGRELFTHHRIPNDSYFSFLEPPRVSPNFRWLFQAIIYAIYTQWGYVGLILLRAALYCGTAAMALRLLFHGQDRGSRLWVALIGSLTVCLLLPRYLNVRPHMFDYFFIPTILYLLELKRDRLMFLPVLAVAWCNIHGVAYPILLLICGSYAFEYLTDRLFRQVSSAKERSFFLPVALSMLMIYCTPHGVRLLSVPFRAQNYLSVYILEMGSLTGEDFSSFYIQQFTPTVFSLFNLFLLASGLAAIVSLTKRPFRISHLLLIGGGVALLARFNRFTYEFVLLSLPMLRANPMHFHCRRPAELPRWVAWIVAGALCLMPLRFLNLLLERRHAAYPFSVKDLPDGVVTFMRAVGAKGKVLNSPNTGGYWRWMLYPSCTIFMNLDGLFRDEDFYLGRAAFVDGEALRKVITRYEPSFISAPVDRRQNFQERIALFPDYRPVFFDDAEVLYVNQRHHPELVRRYELTAINPYTLSVPDVENGAESKDLTPLVREARRLLEIYPKGRSTNLLVGLALQQDGAYDRMLPYADMIIKMFPEDATGYWLQADAYRGLHLYDLAFRGYHEALRRIATPQRRSVVWKKISRMYVQQRAYGDAYRALRRSLTNFFSPDTAVDDLYNLGLTALFAGKEHEAYAAFIYLQQYRLAPEDVEMKAKVEAILAQLESRHHGSPDLEAGIEGR